MSEELGTQIGALIWFFTIVSALACVVLGPVVLLVLLVVMRRRQKAPIQKASPDEN